MRLIIASFSFLLLSFSQIIAQNTTDTPICITVEEPKWIEARSEIIGNNMGSTNELKLVRVNIHLISKTDGSGQFTETGDNLGNAYSGYDFSYDLIEYMQSRMNWNQPMNLPPNNTTALNSKKWKFVLDAVYFIHNDTYYTVPSITTSNLSTVGHNTGYVFNIFLTEGSGPYGGYAQNINPNNRIKYTENRAFYANYTNWNSADPIDWLFDTYSAQLNHELSHLLGLSHTVRYNNGTPCPLSPINHNCDDGCADTPTAWDMQTLTNYHPACGWGNQWTSHCSSNMMDYTGGNSLTPCQLNIIHTNLDNGLKFYRICDAVKNNISICQLQYPEVSYYGKRVTIGGCSNKIIVDNHQKKDVFFSKEVTLENIEITDKSEFEVFFWAECP